MTLHGPHGQAIDTPAGGYLKTANEVIFADDTYTHETYFFLHDASPGAWTITPDAGSTAITGVQQAAGLPSPDVHASLSRRPGGKLQLRYHLHASAVRASHSSSATHSSAPTPSRRRAARRAA